MDGTQCAHVFEITQPECLVCAGRNRSCEKFVERRMSDEKENEPCGRDRPDAGQCGATDVLVRADRPTRAVGVGAERLNRLYREMRHNYEQLNEWGKADGIEVAMEKLRRCACEALQTEEIVVENIDDEKTVQTLSRSYQAQEDEFLKRAVMMAAGRRAGKQGGAALPLSGDEVRRKIEAAKAQMDTGAYRRRG